MSFTDGFKRDIASHVMEVIRDDGVSRHIRFKRPGTMCMHFDLITWPGYLCYTGDMGTYVFRRLHDMFQFFRRGEGRAPYRIDRRYWAEKVEACDKGDGIKEFSEEKFERAVKEYLLEWVRNSAERTTRQERRDLWDAVMDEVIGADGDSGGYRKQVALHDFSHQVNARLKFYFQDFEYSVEDFTHRFTWCCHALEWAVATYDAAKAPAPTN